MAYHPWVWGCSGGAAAPSHSSSDLARKDFPLLLQDSYLTLNSEHWFRTDVPTSERIEIPVTKEQYIVKITELLNKSNDLTLLDLILRLLRKSV